MEESSERGRRPLVVLNMDDEDDEEDQCLPDSAGADSTDRGRQRKRSSREDVDEDEEVVHGELQHPGSSSAREVGGEL